MPENRRLRFWFVIFCVVAAFDFRGQQAGGAIQVALSAVTTLAFVIIVIAPHRRRFDYPVLRRVALIWWVSIVASIPVALWRSVPKGHYGHTLIPELLFGESLIVALILIGQDKRNIRFIYDGLFYSAFISSCVTFLNGALAFDLTLDTVRYQIASPLLPILFTFALGRLLFEGPSAGWKNFAGMGWAIVIMFLSVTRTFIVQIAGTLVLVMFALIFPPSWIGQSVQRRTRRNLVAIAVLGALVGVGVTLAFPTILERWTSRNQNIGSQDPTGLARIAEASGEISIMQHDPSIMVFGAGVGADHKWNDVYVAGVAALEEMNYDDMVYAPAHIAWVSGFFMHGLLLGWAFPVVLFIGLWQGNRRSSPYIARLAGITIIAVIMIATFGNPFMDRSGGLGIGLLVALSLAAPRPLEAEEPNALRKRQNIDLRSSTRSV